MTTNPVAGICGLYWEHRAWYEALGATCETQGDAGLSKICPVYRCAKDHGVEQCGLCSEFPCLLLVHFAAQNGDDRIISASVRAQVGDEVWAGWAQQQRLWVNAYCPLRTATKTIA
jgi:hypothetical protein